VANKYIQVKSAVVGAGAISKQHLQFLTGQTNNSLTEPEQIALVGVCDLSKVTAEYTAKANGTEAFTDYEKMLEQTKPDVVHVLTPPNTHIGLSKLAMQSGANVICEKPITSTKSELEDLLSYAKENGVQITENHNYRFNDEIKLLLSAIHEDQIGSVKEVEIRISLDVTDPSGKFGDQNVVDPIHKMPAGVIHDFTTHFSYLLLTLSQNAEFTTVGSIWRNQSNNPIFKYDNLDSILVGENNDGIVHGRLRFDCETAPDAFSIIVRGSKGYLETDLFQPFIKKVIPRSGGSQLTPIANQVINGFSLSKSGFKNFKDKLLQNSPYHGLHRMLDETYAAILEGKELPVSSEQLLRASSLVDQILNKEAML